MRLIDADELLFELTRWKDNKGWYHDTRTGVYHISEIKTVCDRMPNIDAIPVIRCKDCKHYKQSATADRKMCFRKDIDGFSVCYEFEPNDWCSYAERGEK